MPFPCGGMGMLESLAWSAASGSRAGVALAVGAQGGGELFVSSRRSRSWGQPGAELKSEGFGP